MEYNVYTALERLDTFIAERGDPSEANALDRGEFHALLDSVRLAAAELLQVLVERELVAVAAHNEEVDDDDVFPLDIVEVFEEEHRVVIQVDTTDFEEDAAERVLEGQDFMARLSGEDEAKRMVNFDAPFVADLGTLAYLRSQMLLGKATGFELQRETALLNVVRPQAQELIERLSASGAVRFVDGRRKPLAVSAIHGEPGDPLKVMLKKDDRVNEYHLQARDL